MIFREGDARAHLEEFAREKSLETFDCADVSMGGFDGLSEVDLEQIIIDFFKNGVPDWMDYTGAYDSKAKKCIGDKIDKLVTVRTIDFIKKASKLKDGIVIVDMNSNYVSMDLNTAEELGVDLHSWNFNSLKVPPKCNSTFDMYGNIIESGDLIVTKTFPTPMKVQLVAKNKIFTARGSSHANKAVLIKSVNGNPISYGPFVS